MKNILMSLIFMVFMLSLVSASSLSDTLQNYYKFDNSSYGNKLIDANNNRNGTIGSDVLVNQSGIINQSHRWINTTQNSNVSYAVNLSSYSISFWVKTNISGTFGFVSDNRWEILSTKKNYQGTGSSTNIGNEFTDEQFHHIAISLKDSETNPSQYSKFTVWIDSIKKYETNGWGTTCSGTYGIPNNKNFKFRILAGNFNIQDSVLGSCSNQINFFEFGNLLNNYGNETLNRYVQMDEMSVFVNHYFSDEDIDFLFNAFNPPTYENISGQEPVRILNFTDGTITGTNSTSYSINGYYTNYDTFNVSWFDIATNQTIQFSKRIGDERTSVSGDITVIMDGVINEGDILFKLTALNVDKIINFTIRAINNNGYDEQNFTITTLEAEPPIAEGLFHQIISTLSSIYPDSDTLSTKLQWGYVVFTMLIITGTILFTIGKEHIIIGVWLSIILDVMMFFYFVVINYIGAGTVMTLTLIGIGLFYFSRPR